VLERLKVLFVLAHHRLLLGGDGARIAELELVVGRVVADSLLVGLDVVESFQLDLLY